MFHLALRNLVQNKTRLVLSTAGLGLALALVLFFGAVWEGATGRLTAYIDHAGADVWVSQAGVRTMHMSTSSLPATVAGEVAAVPGVQTAVPILYAEDIVEAGGTDIIAYVFGLPGGAPLGGPWRIVDGAASPGAGEVVLDRAAADKAGISVGDSVSVFGQSMRVAGLNSGGSSIVSSATFVRMEDFSAVRGGGVISFVLVKVAPGESGGAVAARIAAAVPGTTVQTSAEFADQERQLSEDMGADIIAIINVGGYAVGLAVVVLTVYMATVARRREYAVLKAIGIRNRRLYVVVVLQALMSAALGLAAAVILTLVLAQLVPQFNELLVLSLSPGAVFRAAVVALVLASLAGLLPARQLAGLEPIAAMRRG